MVKTLLFQTSSLVALLLCSLLSNAQMKHIVQVSDNVFTPAQFTAHVGDTVRWTFVAGSMENHTTVSKTIPSGAASWNQLVNTANPSFEYIITHAGTYNYECTPHVSLGMIGSFTASPVTSVMSVPTAAMINITPNPAKDKINISTAIDKATIDIIDMQGRSVKSWNNQDKNTIVDISEIAAGLYTVVVGNGKILYKEKLVIID